jgi:hypothetical protein
MIGGPGWFRDRPVGALLRFPAPAGPRLPQVLSAVRAVLATVPVVAVTVGCTGRGEGTPQFAALVREIAESAR